MENTKPKSRLKKVLVIIGIIILVSALGIFILLKLTFLNRIVTAGFKNDVKADDVGVYVGIVVLDRVAYSCLSGTSEKKSVKSQQTVIK